MNPPAPWTRRTGEEILGLFTQLNQQGRTIIVVTHDLKVAGYCQREIYLRDGKIVPSEMRRSAPAQLAVAALFGASQWSKTCFSGRLSSAPFKSLWANKMRSLLAMLGIIIGVGAVIAMIALGAGPRPRSPPIRGPGHQSARRPAGAPGNRRRLHRHPADAGRG